MRKTAGSIVQGITWYRILAVPVLVVMLIIDQPVIFKYLLGGSFFTDLIDGYLARRFKVVSRFGAKIDSIGDDLTVFTGVCGLVIWHHEFVVRQAIPFIILFVAYLIQTGSALYRFGFTTSFHTYLAKLAALLQGFFLLSVFFTGTPLNGFFYFTFIITLLQLIEESIIVWVIPALERDVKGIYWVIRKRLAEKTSD
jgi:CDP-diacylglycerol--glycerol-3-phosphate 3-phosphatidyltransferase